MLLYYSYALIIISNHSFIVSHLRASFGLSYGDSSKDRELLLHIDVTAIITSVEPSDGCGNVTTNVMNRIALLVRVIPKPKCSIAEQVYNVST